VQFTTEKEGPGTGEKFSEPLFDVKQNCPVLVSFFMIEKETFGGRDRLVVT
jgi:hypothetical protein